MCGLVLLGMAWQGLHMTGLRMKRWMAFEAMEHAIKHGLSDEQLTTFEWSGREYANAQWEKPDREFHLEGRMFDIVRKERGSNGSIILHCIEDVVEQRIVARIVESERLALERSGDRNQDRLVFSDMDRIPQQDTKCPLGVPGCLMAYPVLVCVEVANSLRNAPDPPPWQG